MKRPADNYDYQPQKCVGPYQGGFYQDTLAPKPLILESGWPSDIKNFLQQLFKDIYENTSVDKTVECCVYLKSVKDYLNGERGDIDKISKICFVILKCFDNCNEKQIKKLIKWTSNNAGKELNLFSSLILDTIKIPEVYRLFTKSLREVITFLCCRQKSVVDTTKDSELNKNLLTSELKSILTKELALVFPNQEIDPIEHYMISVNTIPLVAEKIIEKTKEKENFSDKDIQVMAESIVFDLISKLKTIDLKIAQRRSLKNIRYLKDTPGLSFLQDIRCLEIWMRHVPASDLLQLALVSKKMSQVYESEIIFRLCSLEPDIGIYDISLYYDFLEKQKRVLDVTTAFITDDSEGKPISTSYLEQLVKCKNLALLEFTEVLMPDEVLKTLCELKNIKILKFDTCYFADEDGDDSRLEVDSLSKMPSLERMDLTSCDVNEDNLPEALSQFKRFFITYPDGSQYEGELKEGLPEGEGTFFNENRTKREMGIFEKGVFVSGKTTYLEKDSVYEGQVNANEKPDGQGIRTYHNGHIEEGTFKDGLYIEGTSTTHLKDENVKDKNVKDVNIMDLDEPN